MDTFNPVKYSREENTFLLENVGKPPVVALKNALPVGVNAKAVRPVLQEVYDREQLRSAEGIEWVGIEAVKAAAKVWLDLDEKWEADFLRTKGRIPRYPSLHVKDGKGRYHLYAPGADSDYPRTYEDKDGNRRHFEIYLDGTEPIYEDEFVKAAPKKLINDVEKHRIECPICAHSESYKTDSRSSYNAARARMSQHLKKPGNEVDLHRELHTNEFSG